MATPTEPNEGFLLKRGERFLQEADAKRRRHSAFLLKIKVPEPVRASKQPAGLSLCVIKKAAVRSAPVDIGS